jgi:MoaA/NifB/PqqE/SkfB family radical SAM enzyme
MYAEVSARGEVTTCHTFYDITVGNVHDVGIHEIWNGNRIRNMRNYLRRDLFPICTACCRYYNNPISAVLAGLDPTPAAAPITTGSEQTRGQVESDCDG